MKNNQIIKVANFFYAVGTYVNPEWTYKVTTVASDLVCLQRCRESGKEYAHNKTNVAYVSTTRLNEIGFEVIV